MIHRPLSENEKVVVVYHLDCQGVARRNPNTRKASILPKAHHMQYVCFPACSILYEP